MATHWETAPVIVPAWRMATVVMILTVSMYGAYSQLIGMQEVVNNKKITAQELVNTRVTSTKFN